MKKKTTQKKSANKKVMQKILNTEAIKQQIIEEPKEDPVWEEPVDEEVVFKTLTNMRHRDMQKLCIEKGMDFLEVVKTDHQNMIAWLYRNWNRTEDPNNLIQFDEWQDTELAHKYGAGDPLRNPMLKFSFVPKEIIQKALPAPETEVKETPKTEPKDKRVKHEDWGITTGTKKFLTYELTITTKMTLPEIVQKVKEKFPAAEEKSIKIWHQRALKLKS